MMQVFKDASKSENWLQAASKSDKHSQQTKQMKQMVI